MRFLRPFNAADKTKLLEFTYMATRALLLIAYLLSSIYKTELRKYRQEARRLSRDNCDLSSKLTDAFKYIGGVNVQIKEIRSIFCGPRRYPATENEFRKNLTLFARKVLGIVNADWVVIRIIRQTNLRTIKEHFEPRKNEIFFTKGISNKAIVQRHAIQHKYRLKKVCIHPG